MLSGEGQKSSVLMVTYQYAPAADGGAARQAQCLAEGLAQRGRRVGVVTARFPGSSKVERLAGVDVHRVWSLPRPGTFSATFIPSLTRFLISEGRRYDIWHAHQAYYNAGVALRIARFLGKRCIVKDAASGPYGDVARLRRSRFGSWVRSELTKADAVISLSSEMTRELIAAGVASSRIRMIPNGVDVGRFKPPSLSARAQERERLGIRPEAQVALFAGRLAQDKGTRFLIDAWKYIEGRAHRNPWSLIIAGDELGSDQYRARGERELATARFVGKVPDVRPFLHAADLLVHPSLSEGLSNIVLEAMAVGLPVLGTRTGGLKEQVVDGETGILVEPANGEALANGIQELLEDRERRRTMGAAGRERVRRLYNLTTMLDAYERLYDGLRQNVD